jgi:hypothetical protein
LKLFAPSIKKIIGLRTLPIGQHRLPGSQ